VAAESYDVAVIGAGHNGLAAAGYLAQAGKSVVVLEARDVVGGACTTEELVAGSDSKWSSCAFIAGLLRPEVIADLELERHGLEMYQSDVLGFSLFADGTHFFLWKDVDRTLREIERYSRRDAQRFLDFGLRVKRFADLVTPFLMQPPPSRSQMLAIFEEAGEEELFNEFVLLSTRDLLDRYFESEHLKGFLTFFGMISIWGGPSTPGTAYVYGHHAWGEFKGQFGQFGFVKGGMGGITVAMQRSAEAHGAVVETGAPVERVLVEGGRARGVRLADGREIAAEVVVSNADPKRSLLGFLDEGVLPAETAAAVERIDQRGSMARIHLLIDELPQYLPFDDASEGPQHRGHQMLGASVENFEMAWEAERRGELPDEYVIEAVIQSTTDDTLAPAGLHTLTLGVQQLPGELSGRSWDEVREEWADAVVADYCKYAPNVADHIVGRAIITPADLERDYGLTGGNIFHAQMFLDQLFAARPLRELADYRTPVDGYFLCGAGMHPGGGVMGAPGHNAAKAILGGPAASTSPAGSAGGARKGVIDRVMETKQGRRLGYEIARRPAFRPLTRFVAKQKGGRR
jgi:phytoene dehydrogenase-like protein